MFEARLKTRKFKHYHVDAYDTENKRIQEA